MRLVGVEGLMEHRRRDWSDMTVMRLMGVALSLDSVDELTVGSFGQRRRIPATSGIAGRDRTPGSRDREIGPITVRDLITYTSIQPDRPCSTPQTHSRLQSLRRRTHLPGRICEV